MLKRSMSGTVRQHLHAPEAEFLHDDDPEVGFLTNVRLWYGLEATRGLYGECICRISGLSIFRGE